MENKQIKLQEIIQSSRLSPLNKRLLLELVSNLGDEDVASLAELAADNPNILLELSNNIYKKIIYLSGDGDSVTELMESGNKISSLIDR